MDQWKDRERGFENRFAHDEEMRFRAIARRNRLAGLWAAERLGLSGTAADHYATEVVRADFEEAGDEDVVRKLQADLGGRADEATIRAKLAECLKTAQEQLMVEVDKAP